MSNKAILHKKYVLGYQKILFNSEKWIKHICRSIIVVLGMSLLASLLFGPIMIDCFIIYCCIALGGVFVFGGIMFLGTLCHWLLANYYFLTAPNDNMVEDIDAKRKVSFINILVASMIAVSHTLVTAILLIGGTGALRLGITKTIDLLVLYQP